MFRSSLIYKLTHPYILKHRMFYNAGFENGSLVCTISEFLNLQTFELLNP